MPANTGTSEDLADNRTFTAFVEAVDMNYHEVYDFYQAVSGADDSQSTFRVMSANGKPDDTLIVYNSYNDIVALLLSLKAKAYLPEWIEDNLMGGLDAESYWGMEHAKEKDKTEDK